MSPLYIQDNLWRSTLQDLEKFSEIYFSQRGSAEHHLEDKGIENFLTKTRPYGSFKILEKSEQETFFLNNILSKQNTMAKVEIFLQRISHLDPKSHYIMAVTDELLLNGLISAPRVAHETQEVNLDKLGIVLGLEWNKSDFWIHCQDPFGLFSRKNFCKSFRDVDDNMIKTHGSSGRGLDVILDHSTDLFIRSSPDWGTWVAARIDLALSSMAAAKIPKRLILDFQ